MGGMRFWILRLHVAALATVIPDLSKILPLGKLLACFTPRRPSRLYTGMTTDQIMQAISHRLRAPWRMRARRCLRKGLLALYFLRLAGVPAVLNIGVYRESGPREQAHCWISVDGRCIADPPEYPYVLMLTYDPPVQRAHEDSRMAA
jgi:hypothetical protein